MLLLTSVLGMLPVFLLGGLIASVGLDRLLIQQVVSILLIAMPIASLCLAAIVSRIHHDHQSELLVGFRQLKSGHFSYRIRSLGDRDSQSLYQSFNTMAEFVQATFARLEHEESNRIRALRAIQLAHDIRSPITTLESLVSQLDPCPRVKKIMNCSLERIRAIAESGLVSHARESDYLVKPVHLVPLIQRVVAEKQTSLAAESQVIFNLEVDQTTDGIQIVANELEIDRMLSNLLNNSMESLDGGTDRPQIEIQLVRRDHSLQILIKDTGCGMTQEQLQAIEQAPVSFKPAGHGLGLAHAKRTIKSLGGSFRISSHFGVGTVVHIEFPLGDGSHPSVVEPLALGSRPAGAVLIDDEVFVRESWMLQAESKGVDLYAFAKEEEFFRTCGRLPKSIPIYVDYCLGDQERNGAEVTRDLYALGFENLWLATGYESKELQNLKWLKGVVGKSPPDWIR